MTDGPRDRDAAAVPPAVAARLAGALDRSPTTVVTLLNADLTIAWLSSSAAWVTGTDPSSRPGASAFERIHPDDVERLLYGLAQLQAAAPIDVPTVPVVSPIRYRFQRFDGRWIVMEAVVHNLLDDPAVRGLLVEARPVDTGLDGIVHVVDLLVDESPLTDVLAACARLVPHHLGACAVVALVDDQVVVGTPDDSPAVSLVDERWWSEAVATGRDHAPTDFAGFPEDLADKARVEGFRTAWMLPLLEALPDPPVLGAVAEVIGCLAVWVRIDIEPVVVLDESLRQLQRLASLVVGEERRRLALGRQAVTDPLTGLQNRSALRRRLDAAPGAVTLAVIDLDDFKPVNDTHGHDAGDVVLQTVAARLAEAVRADDLVVRFGGDEFAVVFADGTTPERASHLAERITDALRAPIAIHDGLIVAVSASIGLATGPADQVVLDADTALYQAKRDKPPTQAPGRRGSNGYDNDNGNGLGG
jgi:diguanylate cyclase (GGDEF)-like protein